MARPMTGQPKTDEELTNATQRANKKMNEEDTPEDIKNHPLTKDSLKDDEDDKTDDEKLEELREFKKNNQDLYEDNGKGGQQIAVSDKEETAMEVTEDGETTAYTREEWDSERGAKTRIWDRLERFGGSYVKVAHWFSDSDVNAVKVGDGFYGEKMDETEKAYKFVCESNSQNHTAESREVWVPKSAVRTHTLE